MNSLFILYFLFVSFFKILFLSFSFALIILLPKYPLLVCNKFHELKR